MANDTPHTRIAGQISIMPRNPAKAQISQNGTISEKNGSCRPTMAPRTYGSNPVTADKLRSHVGGRLKTSAGDLLPLNNSATFPDGALPMANDAQIVPEDQLFAAGDKVEDAEVWLGNDPKVPLVVEKDLVVTLSRKLRKDMKVSVQYTKPVPAPTSSTVIELGSNLSRAIARRNPSAATCGERHCSCPCTTCS